MERFQLGTRSLPGPAGGFVGIDCLLERLGKFEDAIANLERQIELDPRAIGPRLQLDRICALLEPGKIEEGPSEEIEGMDAQERQAALTRARQLVTKPLGGQKAGPCCRPAGR